MTAQAELIATMGLGDITVGLSPARREARFFFAVALACVAIAFVGFAPTFWRPLAQGTFHANPIVYVRIGLFLPKIR